MDTCFVIMPIGKGDAEQAKWREVFEDIFKKCVEDSGLGLICRRADDIDKSGSIMGQVLNELRTAKIVLADLTSRNPNVFYELGVRHTMRKRSILVGQSPEESPFDVNQYRLLVYKHPADQKDEFHTEIKLYLEEAIRNPGKSDNPVADLLPGRLASNDQEMIRATLLELQDNLNTAEQFDIHRTYLPPSCDEWLRLRANLDFLPKDILNELNSAYGKTKRWKGIVESGKCSLTDSVEIRGICQELCSDLPRLIARLDALAGGTS